jgi:Arc/MetJ family transcription regulator
MTKPTGKPRGPRPVDGISRTTMIGSKITEVDLKALRAVMKAKGIPTQSAAVTLAIRAFASANGITVQADDPRQLALIAKK